MSPASLGDLLGEAETATARLIMARPSLEVLAATWPSYTAAAQRMLQACIGVRESNNPVDAALSRTAAEARAAGAGVARPTRLISHHDLARISELLSAAADLLGTHPTPEATAAQLAGLRTAGIVAAASHMVVVAERGRANEGIALRALRLERVANTALAQQASPGLLDEPRAAPVSAPMRHGSVGEGYQTAAVAWRRIAAHDFNPSAHALRTGALSIAHITADLRLAVRAAGVQAGLDEELRSSQDRWGTVAQSWPGFTTATPFMPDARAAADHLRNSSTALRHAVKAAAERHDSQALAELVTAAARGHRDMVALGHDQLSLTRRLGAAGRLYVAARDLPPAEDRIAVSRRRQFVPAPADRVSRLVEPYVAAVKASSHALNAVDRGLATQELAWPTPQLKALSALAARPPHHCRGR